ncbi:hypothetical protein LTR85_008508 [Meristemomyces frigidus]|nr:hypothetical protein LTR85_008508 [Meristemomyces frigidus]
MSDDLLPMTAKDNMTVPAVSQAKHHTLSAAVLGTEEISRAVPKASSASNANRGRPQGTKAKPKSWAARAAPLFATEPAGAVSNAAGADTKPKTPQSYESYAYNVAVKPRAQILSELRQVCDSTMEASDRAETKERLEDEPETYKSRTKVLKQHNAAMHEFVQDIKAAGDPMKVYRQMVTEQLEVESEAREVAEDRVTVLEKEIEKLQEASEGSRRRGAEAKRGIMAGSSASKRPAPREGNEEKEPASKKSRT